MPETTLAEAKHTAADTCDAYDDHDPEADRPRGNRCGRPATRVIAWRDGRWSLGCDEHAAEVAAEVPHLIRSIGARS